MPKNKVQFGVKNVYYSVITETSSSTTYGTPKAVPGAVSISFDADGEASDFYADNIKYYTTVANNGYTGTLEVAKVPEEMETEVFGMTQTTSGLQESVNVEPKLVVLMVQFEGDQTPELYQFYRVRLQRPNITSSTITETKEPQTASLSLTAMPSLDSGNNISGKTFIRSTSSTPDATRTAWFNSVLFA